MKAKYEAAERPLTTQLLQRLLRFVAHTSVHQVVMVAMMGAVARDLFVPPKQQLVRAKSLRMIGYLSALFFAAKVAHQAPAVCRWTSVTSAYRVLAAVKARLQLK